MLFVIDDAEKKKAPIRSSLTLTQLVRLDRILEDIEFGSVKLIVDKGVVKFVEVAVRKKL